MNRRAGHAVSASLQDSRVHSAPSCDRRTHGVRYGSGRRWQAERVDNRALSRDLLHDQGLIRLPRTGLRAATHGLPGIAIGVAHATRHLPAVVCDGNYGGAGVADPAIVQRSPCRNSHMVTVGSWSAGPGRREIPSLNCRSGRLNTCSVSGFASGPPWF